MMRWVTLAAALMLCGSTAIAQVPVVGAEGTATLRQVAGTNTLVTVVLNVGALDQNLRILSTDRNFFRVADTNGDRFTYRYDAVKEVRLQGGRVEVSQIDPSGVVALNKDQRAILERCLQRVVELFMSSGEEAIKVEAATLLFAEGSGDHRAGAQLYLQELARTNDLEKVLYAYLNLFVAGEDTLDRASLRFHLSEGLSSGNRTHRILAATVAGVFRETSQEQALVGLLESRGADVVGPAAVALARMGHTQSIPTLIDMLNSRSYEKGEAAVAALGILGGESVIQQLKLRLPDAEDTEEFRIARVLHNLGEDDGKDVLLHYADEVPTKAQQALLELAEAGDEPSKRKLKERLGARKQPTTDGTVRQAKLVATLLRGGDRNQLAALQEMLRTEDAETEAAVCAVLAEVGLKSVIVLAGPSIESQDPMVAMAACRAAIANANQSYFMRLKEARM
jgi:hypothetical protein